MSSIKLIKLQSKNELTAEPKTKDPETATKVLNTTTSVAGAGVSPPVESKGSVVVNPSSILSLSI